MDVEKELQSPRIVERLMELFCESPLDWICDEMSDDEKEWDICSENCNRKNPTADCVIRYIKMQFRQEGKV